MKSKISQNLIDAATRATEKLSEGEVVFLEKPFSGFYVSYSASSKDDPNLVDSFFVTREGGVKKKVFLICESLLGGGKNQKKT